MRLAQWWCGVWRPQPTTTEQMRRLFSAESRLRQKPEYATPEAKKFRWSRLQAMAQRAVWRIAKRTAA